MSFDLNIIKILAESSSWEDEVFLFDFVGKILDYKLPNSNLGIITIPTSKINDQHKIGLVNIKEIGWPLDKVRLRWSYGTFNLDKKNENTHFLGDNGKQSYFLVLDTKTKAAINFPIEGIVSFLSKTLLHIFKYKNLLKNQHLAHIDDVTGLFNQRKLMQDLEQHISLGQTNHTTFGVMFIDIDHFKRINDGHGHLVGTETLVELSKHLKTCLREDDLIFRYGGDEFVVLLPAVNNKLVLEIGQRIVDTIRDRAFVIKANQTDYEFKMTVSVGIATYPEDATTRDEILNMADRMMYQAKMSGRGKVCHINQYVDDPAKRKLGS